eukprot:JP447264.1.p1 GENE.JP447264.1~~JP447264.1.p1  ORF type:complete len:179 (-),score=19.90 JP447264.1:99-635(-)
MKAKALLCLFCLFAAGALAFPESGTSVPEDVDSDMSLLDDFLEFDDPAAMLDGKLQEDSTSDLDVRYTSEQTYKILSYCQSQEFCERYGISASSLATWFHFGMSFCWFHTSIKCYLSLATENCFVMLTEYLASKWCYHQVEALKREMGRSELSNDLQSGVTLDVDLGIMRNRYCDDLR